MNRRELLKLIGLGLIGSTLDIDKLLWIPGEKKIFISSGISYSQIMGLEMDRILPNIMTLFDRDDTFYSMIKNKNLVSVSGREMKIPLEINPYGNGYS